MKKRIVLLDELRGFVFLLMLTYHLLFDLQFIFGKDIFIFRSQLYQYIAWFIGISYIFISGISSNLSKNIYKRGTICFLAAMIVTIATYIATPQLTIYFGILHFLGIAMFLSPLIKKVADKISPIAVILICLLGFFLTFNLNMGYLGIKPYFFLNIPYKIRELRFLFPFGICSPEFSSGDFYPIFPWIFIYTCGIICGEKLKMKKLPDYYYKAHSKILNFCGKHSLILYLIHQIALVAALEIFFKVLF